ncbi:MAG: GAF domain-containing protein [Chlorobi bacterium]|nr:GAF domain-containing protein [Chlorobiota bacterium]
MDRLRKEQTYSKVLRDIKSVLDPESDWICILSTTAAILHHAFDHYHWTGFYRVVSPDLLIVGPYQGHQACLHIPFGKGVCGKTAELKKTHVVPDVTKFPGYIACSESTKSEIVVPVIDSEGVLRCVLDVDSDYLAAFDDVDARYLEEIARYVGSKYDNTKVYP